MSTKAEFLKIMSEQTEIALATWSCPEKWCKQAFQVFKRSAVIS